MKRRWIVCALLLALLIALQLWAVALAEAQTFQQAAETWQGQTPYRQLSVYYDPHEALPAESMESAARQLLAQYGDTESQPVLAWGGWTDGVAVYHRRQTAATVYSVSGDFFRLHPFPVEVGALYTFGTVGSEVVLNTYAAWALFGSEHCVGELIQLGAETYRVLAVIDHPSGSVNQAAFGTTPQLYIPLEAEDSVTFCEAILPEPVKGTARSAFESNMPKGTIVQNTNRFQLGSLWRTFLTGLDTTTQAPSFLVPTWEFAARQTEKVLLLLWAARFLTILPLIAGLLPPLVSGLRRAGSAFHLPRPGSGRRQ